MSHIENGFDTKVPYSQRIAILLEVYGPHMSEGLCRDLEDARVRCLKYEFLHRNSPLMPAAARRRIFRVIVRQKPLNPFLEQLFSEAGKAAEGTNLDANPDDGGKFCFTASEKL